MSTEPAKPTFNLSISNVIFLSLVTIVLFALHFLRHGMSVDEDALSSIARTSGTVFGMLLWPALLAWFFWRFSGRRKLVGSLVFNLVLGLAILGSVSQYRKESREQAGVRNANRAEVERVQAQIQQAHAQNEQKPTVATKQEFAVNDQPPTEATKQDSGAVSPETENSANGAAGADDSKIEAGVMQAVLKSSYKNMAITMEWEKAFHAVGSGRILDFSRLNQAEEFRAQRDAIGQYIDASQAYHDRLNDMFSAMERRLNPLGPDHPAVRAVLKTYREGQESDKPMIGLLSHHVDYGKHLLALIDFLEARQNEWTFAGGNLAFKNKATRDRFQPLSDAVEREGAKIAEIRNAMAAQSGDDL